MTKFYTLIAVALWQLSAGACTTFFINKNGQLVFGRNYDWVTGSGMVCVNQRGLAKTSSKTSDGETISWVSLYGSVSFNQYGKEFPTGGMNEKGLVVELMWLDGTQYPKPDDRPALGVLQWIQYQLDNCSSVDELIATDKKIRIASKGTTPLHYLVADASGNAATIEFLDGIMKVHRGNELPYPVLTNNRYDESIKRTGIALASAGGNDVSFKDNSIERFAKACSMIRQFQQNDLNIPAIDYSFSILNQVAQGSHTKWSIVYDISNKQVYFKTGAYPDRKQVNFSGFDFSCSSTSKSLDMNQPGKGDVTGSFIDFSIDINRRLVQRSCMESRSQIAISEAAQRQTWEYPAAIHCKK